MIDGLEPARNFAVCPPLAGEGVSAGLGVSEAGAG